MTEMDSMWTQIVQPPQRAGPRFTVCVLAPPAAEVGVFTFAIDVGSVSGVTDHDGPAVRAFHNHALMAYRVPGGGDDPYPFGDLRIAVHQLESRACEIEPLGGQLLLAARAFQLGPLDVERRVLEHGILPAVIEMEVGVDHDAHVSGTQVVLRERIGCVSVDDLPLLEHVVGPADPGVDQDRSCAWVLDHEAVHGDVVERVDPGQMKADDLHQGRNGETAKRPNRSAT